MESMIRSCLDGAQKSVGLVVLIDVFRSSNTILALLSRGASSIIPVATLKEAFSLKERNPDVLLVGERKGITIEGFDLGNSPYEVTNTDLEGRHVVLTTSAGTQGMVQAKNAGKLLVGSFGNGKALIDTINGLDPRLVTWLPVGTEGIKKAVEDEACASYLQGKLRGEGRAMLPLLGHILAGEGARRLRKLGQENDLPFCLCADIFRIVPEVTRENGKLTIKPVLV